VLVSSQSDENLSPMNDLESSNFPTNVLVWGNHQTQVNSSSVCLDEGSSQQSSSLDGENVSNSRCNNGNGMLVIDIPLQNEFSSSSDSRCVEDEMKSPMSTRLRSFKRLLSRDKKLSASSPSSMDVEQGSS
jgi:hypothetical protein